MKTRHALLIGALLAFALVMFLTRHKKSDKINRSTEFEISQKNETGAQRIDIPANVAQNTNSSSNNPGTAIAVKPAISNVTAPVLSEGVLRQFANHIKSMNACLGLSGGGTGAEKSEPTIDNVILNLTKSLGDVAAQLEDWNQVEVIDKNSEKKRIRVDLDYYDGNTPTKRLSMYKINSYGMPEIMELTADQANNPNDSYVDSLKDEAKVIANESGARAYFANGEEVVFSIKNGVLQTLSVNKYDKSFNCFNLDLENSSCSCP